MFVELVFFKPRPNVSEAEVIQSARKIQEIATEMGSAFELELLKTEEGEWVEIVHWNNQEEAHRVEQAVMHMPEAMEAMSVMDESSIRMMFLHPATNLPDANTFTSSPLRNRIRVALKTPVSEVWALIGNLAGFPDYSFGLERVEAKVDSSGVCTGYVCHFKPQDQSGEGIVHTEHIVWYEPNRGWASIAEEGNVFGLTNSLTLVTLEPKGHSTRLTWSQHYEASDLDTLKAEFDQALSDIGENLVRRFGGEVVERYVER